MTKYQATRFAEHAARDYDGQPVVCRCGEPIGGCDRLAVFYAMRGHQLRSH